MIEHNIQESITIRQVSADDLVNCVNLIRTSFKTVADEFGFTEENAPRFTAFATDESRLKYQFFIEQRPMFVCLIKDIIVGYYSVMLISDDEIELNNLAVIPEYRHNGIGEALVLNCFEFALKLGRKKIKIGIVEENIVLRQWYETLGFIHTGCRKYDFFPFTCGYMEKVL